MRIDSHQHFWRYSQKEYSWISDDMAQIRRDFLPEDLKREIDDSGVDGVVAVQARTSLEETRWLLDLARQYPFVRGVVGWVPLCDPQLENHLEELQTGLHGIREVCQGQPDGFMLRPDFLAGLRLLARYDLAYDILIYETQLKEAIRLVDLNPGQIFVLDHMAKPRIKDQAINEWAEQLLELSRRDNVFCKISGIVTEADPAGWTEAQLQPYLGAALEAFGPRRLMFGSDWPVCLVASGYAGWFSIVKDFIAQLTTTDRDEILGGTAVRAYLLS